MPGKRSASKKGRGGRRTGSQRAGVIFPVGRLNRLLKKGRYATRTSGSAGVFMAGVLEYLCSELLELGISIAE